MKANKLVEKLEKVDEEKAVANAFYMIIDPEEIENLITVMQYDNNDQQSADLIAQIMDYFIDKFELSGDEKEALNRLFMSVNNKDKWKGSLQRNNIFKAAHALKIKLPSSMF